MRIRILFPLFVAVLLGLTACKKEFIEGDTVLVNDTVSATNAITLSFNHAWGGALTIGDNNSAWDLDDTLGGLRIPFALRTGDRLIATLQVGLQQSGANGPCTDSLHVSVDAILGSAFTITPASSGVIPFDGAFSVDSLWQQGIWVKQFTHQQELTVGSDMPAPVVQTFAKLWSMDNGCTPGIDSCYIMNRSLTLTVIHS